MHLSPAQLFQCDLERKVGEVASECTSEEDREKVLEHAYAEAVEVLLRAPVIGHLGYWNGLFRLRVIEQAIRAAAEGRYAAYVEVDIRNVNGANRVLGHTRCNSRVIERVAAILRANILSGRSLLSLQADRQQQELLRLVGTTVEQGEVLSQLGESWVQMFRHGGDELSFVVVGFHPRLLSALLDAAYREVAILGQTEELKFLLHPKHPLSFGQWGIGISFGVATIAGTEAAADVPPMADVRVEQMKRFGYVGYARGTGKPQRLKRRYRWRDYPRLWKLAVEYLIFG